MRTRTHDVCLTRLSRNWAKIGEFSIDLREGTGRKRAAAAHPNTGSCAANAGRLFSVDHLSCASETENCGEKGGQRRVCSTASLLQPRIKEARDRKEDFFLLVEGKKKDGFIRMALGMFTDFSLVFKRQRRRRR